MLRFGVWSLEQLFARKVKDVFGKDKNISIELYEELQQQANGSYEEDQEIVLDHFRFGRVFKRTYAKRFATFDKIVVSIAVEQFGRVRKHPLRVHDVAASDGRTSFELYQELTDVYHDRIRFLASDLAPWVYSIRRRGSNFQVITDDEGKVVQIIHPPFVFDLGRHESRFYWINHLIRRRLLKQATELTSFSLRSSGEVQVRKIYLIHKRCRELMEARENFAFERYNVFEPIDREFDLVRAMNILNPAYFGPEEIRRILRCIFESLREGGIFATGSNEGGGSEVEGGIYLRMENGFRLLWASGRGSRVGAAITRFVFGE